MMAVERKARIIKYVTLKRMATVAVLAQEFRVHEATIRRDLIEIEQEGHLLRTHGGVIVNYRAGTEPSFVERANDQLDEKTRIGKQAAAFIEDGDHVILDSGTTTIHIAKHLVHRSNITVITNDINIAAELRDSSGVKVIVTGGHLYRSSYMLNGLFTDQALRALHVQKAFIGTPAIHSEYGLTHPEDQLVPTKQGMIQSAQEVIVVADHTKVGKVSLHTIAPTQSIHTLITGKEITDDLYQQFKDADIHIVTV